MSGKQQMTRNLLAQEPGRVDGHANAAFDPNVPLRKPRRHTAGTPYIITPREGGQLRIVVSGRVQWALNELCRAGSVGCTPIHNPAPRWAAYVYDLREMGVEIETITETHQGEFPGHHARYVLRCGVVREWKGGCRMNKLQILNLRRLHGLTEAQAQAIAALVWGC
jgi:hypothetical protein